MNRYNKLITFAFSNNSKDLLLLVATSISSSFNVKGSNSQFGGTSSIFEDPFHFKSILALFFVCLVSSDYALGWFSQVSPLVIQSFGLAGIFLICVYVLYVFQFYPSLLLLHIIYNFSFYILHFYSSLFFYSPIFFLHLTSPLSNL